MFSPMEAAGALVAQGVDWRLHGRARPDFDCWGFVRWGRRVWFAKRSPSWASAYNVGDHVSNTTLAAKMATLVSERLNAWRSVGPSPGAVVLLTVFHRPAHVGLMLDERNFAHVAIGSGLCIEAVDGEKWKRRVEGYYDA